MAGMIIISVVASSITYPLGGYYLRILSHQGNERIKEFIENIHHDLQAEDAIKAEKKIESILSQWEDIEFLEQESDWGIYIGDIVDQTKLIEKKTEPVAAGQRR